MPMTLGEAAGREEPLALGLPATRLSLLGLALAGAGEVLRAALPLGPRVVLGGLVLGIGALLAWARLLDLPASGWAIRLVAFWLRTLAARMEGALWREAE